MINFDFPQFMPKKKKEEPLFVPMDSQIQTSTPAYLSSKTKDNTSTLSNFFPALSETTRKFVAEGPKGLFSKEPAPIWKEAGKQFVQQAEKSMTTEAEVDGKKVRAFNPIAILSGEPLKNVGAKIAKPLTTKFLNYIDDKLAKNPNASLSKQEILDFARRPELKRGEADMLLKKLEEFQQFDENYIFTGTKNGEQISREGLKNRPMSEVVSADIAGGYSGDVYFTKPSFFSDSMEYAKGYGGNAGKGTTFAIDKRKLNIISQEEFEKLNESGELISFLEKKGIYLGDDPGAYFTKSGKEISLGDKKAIDKIGEYGKEFWAKKGIDGVEVPWIRDEEVGLSSLIGQKKEFALLRDLKPSELINVNSSKLPTQDFADSIRRDLLELKPVKVKSPQYSNMSIDAREYSNPNLGQGENLRRLSSSGRSKNYEEVVFESPIKTDGSSHYPNSKNYFAHARGDEVVESGFSDAFYELEQRQAKIKPGVRKEYYFDEQSYEFHKTLAEYGENSKYAVSWLRDWVGQVGDINRQQTPAKVVEDFFDNLNAKPHKSVTVYKSIPVKTSVNKSKYTSWSLDLESAKEYGVVIQSEQGVETRIISKVISPDEALLHIPSLPKKFKDILLDSEFGDTESEIILKPFLKFEKNNTVKIWREQEIQSDLLQKDNLAKNENLTGESIDNLTKAEQTTFDSSENPTQFLKELADKRKSQLDPFTNDRFGERIMRERIKAKAQAGYEKYRLPTGETIGKIEGFQETSWSLNRGEGKPSKELYPEDLKVGITVNNSADNLDYQNDWIITDILGDGRFKAVPKANWESMQKAKELGGIYDDGFIERERLRTTETFDLTGKSNPQYRRYEQWGKFLKNKYGGKIITDSQGNTWMEIDLKKEMGKMPIEAYGIGAIPFMPQIQQLFVPQDEEKKDSTIPMMPEKKPNYTYESKDYKNTQDLEAFKDKRLKEIYNTSVKGIKTASLKQNPIDKPNKENTVDGYNFSKYATKKDAIPVIREIYSKLPDMQMAKQAQSEIDRISKIKKKGTTLTGQMVFNSAQDYGVSIKMLIALMQKETNLGTELLKGSENNFGNILNTDDGNKQSYTTPQEGVDAVARELQRRETNE